MLSSGYPIHLEKFHDYSVQTARLLVEKYHWYRLPPSVHKIFIHGAAIIAETSKDSDLPIGIFSEEAQEAQNKHLRSVLWHPFHIIIVCSI